MRIFKIFAASVLSAALVVCSSMPASAVRIVSQVGSIGAPVGAGAAGAGVLQAGPGTVGSPSLSLTGASLQGSLPTLTPAPGLRGGTVNTGTRFAAAETDSSKALKAYLEAQLYAASREVERKAAEAKNPLKNAERSAQTVRPQSEGGKLKATSVIAPRIKDGQAASYVDLIVQFKDSQQALSNDRHVDWIDFDGNGGRTLHDTLAAMDTEVRAAAGMSTFERNALGVLPIGTYRRINAATLRVPKANEAHFRESMAQKGHTVFENETIELEPPMEDDARFGAQYAPNGAKISMPDTLKLSTMEKVHAVARKLWGPPGTGFFAAVARGIRRLVGLTPAQPKVAVLDTGADKDHKLMASMKESKNFTSGANVDDNGHGSWVTSMVLWFAPWLKSVTHYKIFNAARTSTDIILQALTQAGNDGNLVMSNSWGSSYGDPKSPSSQLVAKLAEEGHIMIFAAGNSGYYGRNTIGAPAIVHYRDAATGALRVIAVAATDRDKTVVRFSSKGKGSRVTSRGGEYENYPRKPDAAEQGENTEAAWPANLKPDRTDPKLGTLRAISGTSMSTPKFAGTVSMLTSLFGVTKVGKELDAIVNAVMGTLSNEDHQADWAIGDGFNVVYAAYQRLRAEGMTPKGATPLQRAALRLMGFNRPVKPAPKKKVDPGLKGWTSADLLEAIMKDVRHMDGVPGFRGIRINEGGPDHVNPALRNTQYVVMVWDHPRDLDRHLDSGYSTVWKAGGLPAVYDFLSKEGIREMTVTLEKQD